MMQSQWKTRAVCALALLLLGAAACAPKLEKAPEPAAPAYVITVTDEAGQPIAGVTLQICDASTCQMATTGEDGKVTHTGAPYAYEIHVLKAPEGYAQDTEAYVMPAEGGELVIQLKKQ